MPIPPLLPINPLRHNSALSQDDSLPHREQSTKGTAHTLLEAFLTKAGPKSLSSPPLAIFPQKPPQGGVGKHPAHQLKALSVTQKLSGALFPSSCYRLAIKTRKGMEEDLEQLQPILFALIFCLCDKAAEGCTLLLQLADVAALPVQQALIALLQLVQQQHVLPDEELVEQLEIGLEFFDFQLHLFLQREEKAFWEWLQEGGAEKSAPLWGAVLPSVSSRTTRSCISPMHHSQNRAKSAQV